MSQNTPEFVLFDEKTSRFLKNSEVWVKILESGGLAPVINKLTELPIVIYRSFLFFLFFIVPSNGFIDALHDLARDLWRYINGFQVLLQLFHTRRASDDRTNIGILEIHAMESCDSVQPSSFAMGSSARTFSVCWIAFSLTQS